MSSASTVSLEVAIVGAGPAGAATARALAGRGWRVGLIEKAALPRHKTCGGGVVARAARLAGDFQGVVESECRAAELVHHDPDLRFICRRAQRIISMVMRDRFDHCLVNQAVQAGTELFADTTLNGLRVDPDGVLLETSRGNFKAKYMIAADGANSAVARLTGRRPLTNIVPALEVEVTVAAGELERWRDVARFDFGFVPFGYAWVFPKREHLSIGVLTTRRGSASLPEYFSSYIHALGIGESIAQERHGYIIPCRPRAGLFDLPRVLFTGDAAGLADPLTAEGITAGLQSGRLAAEALVAGQLDVARVQRLYEKWLRSSLLRELRLARGLAWIIYNCPRLRGRLWGRHGQALSELVTQIVAGETTYGAELRRLGNYLRLLGR